jgi:hypothetical protein
LSVSPTKENIENRLMIGWAEAEITPDKPVFMAGMFHARLSEGVLDPITVTALALQSGQEQAVFVSCDVVTIPDELRDAVRDHLQGQADMDPMKVILHATHTHSGPEIRVPSAIAGHTSVGGTGVELDGMAIEDYTAFAAKRIADAIVRAWKAKAPGAIGFGLGYAVIGRNRRWVGADGMVTKYNLQPSVCDHFRHIEGYEDHSVHVIAVYDSRSQMTGLVINVPCPSQLSESEFSLSSDWWHEVRLELRLRFGEPLFLLPQCSAAGDLCPFPLYEQEANARMLELKGQTDRQEIALRIADAVSEIVPSIGKRIDYAPALRHAVKTIELPATRLSEEDVESARRETEAWKAVYEQEMQRLAEHPELMQKPRWYVTATDAYRRMRWNQNVIHRFEHQKANATLPAELHMVQLGQVGFAANPFELYLDYGVQIKARSPAIQTFVVQLAGGGTYLPSPRSVSGGGYGSIPASNPVGPEGGQMLVDQTIEGIRSIWVEQRN